MHEMAKKRNELWAQTVIKGLESRNMTGYYAATKEEALKKALELIPEGSTVSCSHYHSRSVHFRQGCLIHHTSRTDQCQAVSPY